MSKPTLPTRIKYQVYRQLRPDEAGARMWEPTGRASEDRAAIEELAASLASGPTYPGKTWGNCAVVETVERPVRMFWCQTLEGVQL